MLIDIINSKSREIVSVPVTATMKAVIGIMSTKKIGAVALSDAAGAFVGLVTEKNIVDGCAQHGAGFFDQPASAHMVSPVPACDLSDSVSRTMRRMTKDRTRHLFVTDAGKHVGFISIGDVVKARMRDADLEALVLRDIAQARLLSSS